MDDKDNLAELQDLGTRLLKTDEYRGIIEKIAHMLVASTFYFAKDRFWYKEDSGTYGCTDTDHGERLIAEDMINETSLDKRAELIKERRYGGLAVANDPKVALSGHPDGSVEKPRQEDQHHNDDGDGKQGVVTRTDSDEMMPTTATANNAVPGRRTISRDSSQTLVSQLSGESSASAATKRNVSIVGLRAQAQGAAQDGHDGLITVEDGDELARRMSATWSLGGAGARIGAVEPNFGSDDSDGPPSEDEEDEDEDEDEEKEQIGRMRK
ncbi:MAG: hypothetical protein Q9207_004459 [Kuettlingeria erythrocarpa]